MDAFFNLEDPLQQSELIDSSTHNNSKKNKENEIFGYKNQEEFQRAFSKFTLKYYNLFAFLFLPFYTFIAFLVFRKPHNYGEHLIVNTYIQSILLFVNVCLFFISLSVGINIYLSGSMILTVLIYSYVYKRLNKLSFPQLTLKILKLIGVLFVLLFLILVIGIIAGIISKLK